MFEGNQQMKRVDVFFLLKTKHSHCNSLLSKIFVFLFVHIGKGIVESEFRNKYFFIDLVLCSKRKKYETMTHKSIGVSNKQFFLAFGLFRQKISLNLLNKKNLQF